MHPLLHSPRFQIVIIRLTDTPQKVHWVGKGQVPVYSFQDVTLRGQNLRFGVRGIRTVKEVRNGRCDNLFDLRGNERTAQSEMLDLAVKCRDCDTSRDKRQQLCLSVSLHY